MFDFKRAPRVHRTTTKERRLGWRESEPAWLRYRIAHRIVRVAMRDAKLPTDIDTYKANGEWQLKIFVLRTGGVSVGYCYGALEEQMRKTFRPIGAYLIVIQPNAWEQTQAQLVKARRAWQRRAVRKEMGC